MVKKSKSQKIVDVVCERSLIQNQISLLMLSKIRFNYTALIPRCFENFFMHVTLSRCGSPHLKDIEKCKSSLSVAPL